MNNPWFHTFSRCGNCCLVNFSFTLSLYRSPFWCLFVWSPIPTFFCLSSFILLHSFKMCHQFSRDYFTTPTWFLIVSFLIFLVIFTMGLNTIISVTYNLIFSCVIAAYVSDTCMSIVEWTVSKIPFFVWFFFCINTVQHC